MEVVRSLEAWPAWAAGRATVATVGNFDGVHRAHRQLLAAVRREAEQEGALAAAVSFEPHPSRILQPAAAPPLITPGAERIRQLATTGIEALLLLPFSRELSLWSAREFAERVLVRGLRARAVHEGENFRFGHRHLGTVATLAELGREFGFAVRVQARVEARGEVVSSSRIRELVAAGAVERARALLGRAFAVRGPVAAGRGVGRQLTVPTLNLSPYQELLPAAGVYCTCLRLGGEWRAALTNVGMRPTFGPGGPLTVETHVLHPPPAGLEAQPGDEMEIAFLRRWRAERRFEAPAALRAQIERDLAFAERYFAKFGLR
ncbi:MAG TPA: riboflavin biosynthesis protein RibF [Terriglobales bacterium]|nr:riboflavin biosynthesis protein RibF [Terriglobales bacterium]